MACLVLRWVGFARKNYIHTCSSLAHVSNPRNTLQNVVPVSTMDSPVVLLNAKALPNCDHRTYSMEGVKLCWPLTLDRDGAFEHRLSGLLALFREVRSGSSMGFLLHACHMSM